MHASFSSIFRLFAGVPPEITGRGSKSRGGIYRGASVICGALFDNVTLEAIDGMSWAVLVHGQYGVTTLYCANWGLLNNQWVVRRARDSGD